MVKESYNHKMAINIQGNLKTIRKMVLEIYTIQMEKNLKDNFKMII